LRRYAHETDEWAHLGAAVRERRLLRGLTRAELASAARASESRLEAFEDGRVDPGYVLFVRLAKALGVGADALLIRARELEERAASVPPKSAGEPPGSAGEPPGVAGE